MNNKLAVMEMIDIRIAIQSEIDKCNNTIAECDKYNLNKDIFVDKRDSLISGLSKLNKQYNDFML
jgi:hypothetical protein